MAEKKGFIIYTLCCMGETLAILIAPNELEIGFKECMRVLKTNGTLIFKWNETDVKVSEIISIVGQEPLFGHKSGKMMKTHWLTFFKSVGKISKTELKNETSSYTEM